MTAFNYNPLRVTTLGLIKKFGKQGTCFLLRAVNPAATDLSKPWRVSDPAVVKQFKFIGVFSTLDLGHRFAADQDQSVLAPGDLAETAAEGDPLTLCGMPTRADRIQTPDLLLQILSVKDITPDAKSFMFKMHCRAWPLASPQPGVFNG